MSSPCIFAQVVFDLAVDGPFDYSIPEALRSSIALGCRVVVMFNRRKTIGFVVGIRERADVDKVLPVLSLPDEGPVFDALHLEWMLRFSRYYGCSRGQALAMSLPASLRRSSRVCVPGYLNAPAVPLFKEGGEKASRDNSPSLLNPALGGTSQRVSASSAPQAAHYTLIHDPFQKEQWPLIESRIKTFWDEGRSILILVPEISAFKQWRDLLRPYRKNVFVVDPSLKDKERTAQWLAVRQSSQAIVFGTRSAVFVPLHDPGLIIMADEDHHFYKEEQSPFHHVREVVLWKAEMTSCAAVFVSRTPSPELWEAANRQHWNLQTCPVQQKGTFQRIDVTNFSQIDAVTLTLPLIKRIDEALAEKKKIILYWNRRGYHRVTQCGQCGENIRCPHCDVNLVYSLERKTLFCGRCGFSEVSGQACPKCHSPLLKSFGRGGEKFAKDLKKFFPAAVIDRYSSDVKEMPEADIIIATQSIVGRETPGLCGLIAVLDFDGEMAHPDFRAPHKAFDLLVKLRLKTEHLVVQTRNPSDEILCAADSLDFERFYRYDLGIRKTLQLPPFGHLLEVVVRGLKLDAVAAGADAVFELIRNEIKSPVSVSDPQPDSRPKLRDKYRFRMILKGPDAEAMTSTVKETLRNFRKGGLVVTINLDP